MRDAFSVFLSKPIARIVWWTLLSIPVCVLLFRVVGEVLAFGPGLGADPADEIVDYLGSWSIRLLYLTLAISSVSRLAKLPQLIRLRRITGLWAFSFVLLHVCSYLGILAGFDVNAILADFTKRPYIIVGLIGLLTLVPLAITSTRGWQRRLGVNWRRLHMIVYITAIAAWIHLFWIEKATFEESAIYGVILILLALERIRHYVERARRIQSRHHRG